MISILGILVVLGAIVGGYLMEHGQILVLLQCSRTSPSPP
jgi:flagellar motor component MotA